jgi:CheY-like chemotaxis protein
MGLRILVVEDEMTVALLIEDMLTDMGHQVVGLAMRLAPALDQAATADFDLAILDVNLDGRMSFPVAEMLAARNIPFAFATGYGSAVIAPEFHSRPVLRKPFLSRDLEELIVRAVAGYGSRP